MCGIAGIHRLSDRPNAKIDALAGHLLLGIEPRGKDATGYVALGDDGTITMQKASCDAFHFNKHRRVIPAEVRTILLHTRLATQGDPAFPENNHPVQSGDIYVVHNGHIWNDGSLFDKIDMPRHGKVDSEVIPALIRARGWAAAPKCLAELDGNLAIAAINAAKPGELLLARGNDSPLFYVKTRGGLLIWASTPGAIYKAWGRVLGTPPKPDRIARMAVGGALRVRGGKIRESRFKPGWGYTSTRNWDAMSKRAWRIPESDSGTSSDGPTTPRPMSSQVPGGTITYLNGKTYYNGMEAEIITVDENEVEEESDEDAEYHADAARFLRGFLSEDGETVLDADMHAKCADCGEWDDRNMMVDIPIPGESNELVCWACYTHLVAEGVVEDDKVRLMLEDEA